MRQADYLDRAAKEVEKAKARLPHYAGDCSACGWSTRRRMDLVCEHPAVVCAAFNVTDAYARDRLQECDYQRDTDTLYGPVVCGPDGALFERKERWWKQLFAPDRKP